MATASLIFDILYKNAEMASEFGCKESSKIVVTLTSRTISKKTPITSKETYVVPQFSNSNFLNMLPSIR